LLTLQFACDTHGVRDGWLGPKLRKPIPVALTKPFLRKHQALLAVVSLQARCPKLRDNGFQRVVRQFIETNP
jgi:hypothetical protein